MGKRNNNKGLDVNRLYHFAEKYRKEDTNENELLQNDMTYEFYNEIEKRIKSKDIILINVNGRVRSGKSTVGLAIAQDILKLENKYFPNVCPHKKFSMKNVARDQSEKSLMMKHPEYTYTCILTDEVNESEKTGQNATTERAIQIDQSNVQAARYVHGVYCNPNEAFDPNVDILLNVVAKDTVKRICRCKLFYKYSEGLVSYSPQLLGYVDIYVGDLINEWVKMEPIFVKKKKTKDEENRVKQFAKDDFYCLYMVQKMLKIDLASKHNITRARDINYVKVSLDVIEEMKPLTRIKIAGYNPLSPDSIRLTVKKFQRQRKVTASLIGESLAVSDVKPLLEDYKGLNEIKKQETLIKSKIIKNRGKSNELELTLKQELEDIDLARGLIKLKIKDYLEELHKYITFSEDYNKHLDQLDIKEIVLN